LLPVENPGYLFVRESAATMEETTILFTKKKGSSSSKPSSITSLKRHSVSDLLWAWRRTQHCRGGTILFSSTG
jgi:hypothetical protein